MSVSKGKQLSLNSAHWPWLRTQPQLPIPHEFISACHKEIINPGWKISQNRRLKLLQSQTAAQWQASPCLLTSSHAHAFRVSRTGSTRIPQNVKPEQQCMLSLCKSDKPPLVPQPLPPNVPFLYSAFRREANEKAFSKLCVGEVSTPLA